MHPVSLAARYLPPRSQDTNLRILQRLVFGDLSKLGYPRSQICAPDVVICATGYRPDLDRLVGQQVELDTSGMPPFTRDVLAGAPRALVLRPGPEHLRQHAHPPPAGPAARASDRYNLHGRSDVLATA